MTLTNSDMDALITLRRALHRAPEVSGHEAGTAATIAEALGEGPDQIVRGLGGHGIAAVYQGGSEGPTVLFRCELDALPIQERGTVPHASGVEGVAHLCGHDGHMAILTGLGRMLARRRPLRGRAVLLFQPAEETGAGAAAVLGHPNFAPLRPDYAFALHNRPAMPLGHIGIASGPAACASRGMRITLRGKEAHASDPDTGVSPMAAMAEIMPALQALSQGAFPDPDFRLVTLTHARLGAPAFGIAPGEAEIFATLRTAHDAGMQALVDGAEALVQDAAARHGLAAEWAYDEVFRHCDNDPEATEIVRAAAEGLGMPHDTSGCPMRPSEDFGRFGDGAKAAMLYLGAGEERPALHNPDYDFPDALIGQGARLFHRIATDLLG